MKNKCIYKGRVFTYFLISALADCRVKQSPIALGAAFHTLFPSFRNVDCDIKDLPLQSWSFPFGVDLEPLWLVSFFGTQMFSGELCWFIAFHTSVSFIWAFILLTDSMFRLVINVSVFILSLILFEFKNLIILFWTIWIARRSWFWVSAFDIFTFPRSWSPYLILELKRLSATFVRDFLFKLLFSVSIGHLNTDTGMVKKVNTKFQWKFI